MRDRGRRTGRAYAAIPNAAMRDETVSIEARGLLALLMTYADDWTFVFEHIQRIACVGRDKLRNMLRELEAAGYVTRETIRGDGGRVCGTEWVIADEPRTTASGGDGKADPQPAGEHAGNEAEHRQPEIQGIGVTDPLKNRPPEKPTAGESAPIRRTTLKKTNLKNPQPPAEAGGGVGVYDDQDRFGEFWEAYPQPVEETAARRAWARATRGESAEVVTGIIAAARAYSQDDRVKRGFAKLPANWLLDRCWEEPARPAPSPSAAGATPARGPADLAALAGLWAPKIAAGQFVPPSAISVPLARHMRQAGMVSDDQLRRAGVSF